MRWPAPLNSGEVARFMLPTATAKEISVGGTSRFSNEPDMESLPPIAPAPRSTCAISAPSTAAVGLPQRSGSSRSFSKYSWKLRYAFSCSKPAATSFDSDSTTDRYAPVNWFFDMMYGLKPHAMAEAVVVSLNTGSLATMASFGVSCLRPPNGMSTVPAPIVESKRSDRPLFDATLRSVTTAFMRSASEPSRHEAGTSYASCSSTRTT